MRSALASQKVNVVATVASVVGPGKPMTALTGRQPRAVAGIGGEDEIEKQKFDLI